MDKELSIQQIGQRIYFIREHRVMLDHDLAQLYQVETKVLNQAVRRNVDRFPEDFMFRLTKEEHQFLRSQFVTLRTGEWGKHTKYLPFVFTEQGVAMLSSVLKSKISIQVNIVIMRTFVQLRRVLESHKELADKLYIIERKLSEHDQEFESVFEAIRRLMDTGLPLTQKKIVPPGRE